MLEDWGLVGVVDLKGQFSQSMGDKSVKKNHISCFCVARIAFSASPAVWLRSEKSFGKSSNALAVVC